MAHAIVRGHSKLSAEICWKVATDLRRIPQWHTNVVEVRDFVGGIGQIGTTATLFLKGPDRVHEVPTKVTAAEAPLLWKTEGQEPGGMSFVSITRYTPTPDGGADWEWEQEIDPPKGLIGAFADRLFLQRSIERQMQHSADNLAALTEADALQPA